MELSKRALGFLCRQYRIILSQNRLANALGSCALSALVCASVGVMGGVTAGFVDPESALAANPGVEITGATKSWTSTGDISASSTSSTDAIGILAAPAGSLSITLESGHTVTVSSTVVGALAKAYGINSEVMSGKNIIISNGAIDVTSTGDDADAFGINAMGSNNEIANSGTMTISASVEGSEAYGINAMGSNNDITNSGTIDIIGTAETYDADAAGIGASGDNNDIANSGTITISATAEDDVHAVGIGASSTNATTITNDGTIDIIATAETDDVHATGINAIGANNDIANSGTITISATAEDDAKATGLMASSDNNDIANSGTITISATAATDDADVTGIMAMGDNNDIANSGTITISATAEDTAIAVGIGASGDNNDIANSGTITISATAETGNADVCGISVMGHNNTTIINDGTIDIIATGESNAYATGIRGGGANNDIANSGTINLSATGESNAYATGIRGGGTNNDIANSGAITISATGELDADATGIDMEAMGGNNLITNSGTIDLSATAATDDATGIVARGDNNDIANSGTITATATAEVDKADAYGIRAMMGDNNTIANSGTIDLSATAATDDGYALGIEVRGTNTNSVTNNGTINLSTTAELDATAYGIAGSASNNEITNSGTMTLSATAATGDADTAGISVGGSTNEITNDGTMTISATATTGEAYASGIGVHSDDGALTNNGTITLSASATTGVAYALGMVADGTNTTLNNFGIINVSATGENTNASQAYAYSGTANVGTWTLKLGESYGPSSSADLGAGYYVFGVESGATLNFGATADQGTDFIIYGLGDDFKSGQEYKISDMIYNNGGTVTGYIASVASPSDFLKIELVDGGTAADYTDQSIKGTLNITKDNSPTHAGATQLIAGVKGHMSGLSKVLNNLRGSFGDDQSDVASAKSDTSTMYADASETFTDAGGSYISPNSPVWKAFIMPFYSTTSAHNDAYSTDMGGLVVGASRNVNDNLVLGFHASVSKADSDGVHTDSDTTSYALGVNGVYTIDESLYVRGQLTGFYAVNDIDMTSGAQTASADMGSYGMYAELAAGYDYVLAPQHMLTPELGLSYVYAHMDGFNSSFVGGMSPISFGMDSENYDALYADASVRWTGTFDLGTSEKGSERGTLKPTVKAGIRQALTDPEVSSTMNIFGSSATTHADANETAFTCEAGLAWDLGDVNTSLTYTGEFGDVENSHMGMFKVEWEF